MIIGKVAGLLQLPQIIYFWLFRSEKKRVSYYKQAALKFCLIISNYIMRHCSIEISDNIMYR